MSPVSRQMQKPMVPISTRVTTAAPKGVTKEWLLWKANMEAYSASNANRTPRAI